MRVLECANKLLEILALNDYHRNSAGARMSILNSAIATKIKKTARNHGALGQHRLARRGIHFTPWKAHM